VLVGWLKANTAVTIKIGPFVDETDGFTAETGLTISQADVRLSKNGGALNQKNESTSCTHDAIGIYGCPLNTTDTNTLGLLSVFVHESGARPVRHDYLISPNSIFNAFFTLSGLLNTNVEEIEGTAATTELVTGAEQAIGNKIAGIDNFSAATQTIVRGTVDTVTNTHTPTTSEFQADDVTEATASHYKGRIVIFTSGALQNQAAEITGYAAVGGIGQFTVSTMTDAPSNNDTFVIL